MSDKITPGAVVAAVPAPRAMDVTYAYWFAMLAASALGTNLGDLWAEGEPHWERILALPDVKLHLYGKLQPRPGRKMGHLTVLADDAESALARVEQGRQALVREIH